MKKSLIAIAALAAAGAVSAQSSVTLFGILDVGVARITGSNASITGLSNSGGGSGSRLGFRGTEDLGGGLSAGFWLEAGVNVDSGAGGQTSTNNINTTGLSPSGALTFNRRSTVSLAGNFGEARLGRDFTPTYQIETAFDPFGNNGVGAPVWYQTNLIGDTRLRASNQVSYFLPSLGGLYGQISYAIGEQTSNAGTPAGSLKNDGRTVGVRLGYANGPLDIAVAANKATYTFQAPNPAGASNDRDHAAIGGSFDFGVAKLWGQYSRQKAENQVGGVASLNNDTIAKGALIGVTAPVGPGLIKATYSVVKIDNGAALGSEPESKKFAIGYDYNLSKRTRLYGTLARLNNSKGANLTVGGYSGLGSASTAANDSSNGYEIGLRHTF